MIMEQDDEEHVVIPIAGTRCREFPPQSRPDGRRLHFRSMNFTRTKPLCANSAENGALPAPPAKEFSPLKAHHTDLYRSNRNGISTTFLTGRIVRSSLVGSPGRVRDSKARPPAKV